MKEQSVTIITDLLKSSLYFAENKSIVIPMKHLSIYFTLFAISFLLNCNNSKKENSYTVKFDEATLEKGFSILNTNCFSCHNPNPNTKIRVAPNFKEIKLAYLEKFQDPESFSEHFTTFLDNPSKDNAIIPEAIEKYGVMPKIGYSKEELYAITSYIYSSEIETDNWYAVTLSKEKEKYLKTNIKKDPVEIGKDIAMQTKSVLGKNLLNAIKTKGTEEAVMFCSTRAIPLTDSMAVALNASIKRVSDLNRNPNNLANENELVYIQESKQLLANDQDIKPKKLEAGNKTICYYPITTNAMCLQCHGKVGTDVTPQTYTAIKSLYPEDKAVGYNENELRGIWVVEMDTPKP